MVYSLVRKSVFEPMLLAGSEVSAMKSLLKKDSSLSIENRSFKVFALLLAFSYPEIINAKQ